MPVDVIVDLLGLEPLPDEGGMWSQVLIDADSTAIFYLLSGDDFSALHRLPGTEIYHHYMGAPLALLLLHPDGSVTRPVLGTDLASGERPAIVVTGGVWQASHSLGAWTLVGTTMSPPFDFDDLEMGDQRLLSEQYPSAVADIASKSR